MYAVRGKKIARAATSQVGNSVALLSAKPTLFIKIADMIADDGEEIEDQVNANFVLDKILRVVNTKLSPREREVVIKRFGLNNQKMLTQNEIAKQIGISRSYIS